MAGAVVVIAASAVIVALVYRDIECAYVSRLSEVYRQAHEICEPTMAAAVCCRMSDGHVVYRRVRTVVEPELV